MKHQAILNLAPKAQFSITYGEDGKDVINWLSKDIKQPTDKAVAKELERLEIEAQRQEQVNAIDQKTEAKIFEMMGADNKQDCLVNEINELGKAIRLIGYKQVTGKNLPNAVETLTAINAQQEKIKAVIKDGREKKADIKV